MRTTQAPRGARAGGFPGSCDGDGVPAATSESTAPGGGFRPLAGAALLERLRETGRPRPPADPAFADELRSYLEDGVADLVTRRPPVDDGAYVTPDRLDRVLTCAAHRRVGHPGERTFTLPLACGALVRVLFRQVVTVGCTADPMAEALEGLSLDDREVPLVAWIEGLARAERAELEAEVVRQARGLSERWPPLGPGWLPRTGEILRAPLGDGALELGTRVDLALGRPAADEATVALVGVASGTRRPDHRHDRAVDALVETLRSSVPPFVVATYYSRTGELDVDPVCRELLVAAAGRCLVGSRLLLGGDGAPDETRWCVACATRLRSSPTVLVGGTDGAPDGRVAVVVDLPHGQAA